MSIPSFTQTANDEQARGGAFYRCEDTHQCGMRFPVTVGDPFRGHCPRCGAPVRLVAKVELSENAAAYTEGSSGVTVAGTSSEIHLLLDNWRSLFNVGAAFRTADGAGVRHLYLCGITATPDRQPKLAKTALGAEQSVAWSYHADAVKLVATLQCQHAQVWVLESGNASHSLFDITSLPSASPVILAAGNEVLGVDPGLVEIADRVIHLPMLGSKQSLNAAVALSIATYWLAAQPAVANDG
jgi:23S rRNA (guanosine2251-2'-O)-methyltransferase